MLVAVGLSLAHGSALPAVAIGAGSLAVYIARGRGRYTPGSGFGLANALTLVRLVAIGGLAVLAREAPGPAAALLALAIFVLDGLDGLVARRLRQSSEFGARFDMECDALFVEVCALALYSHGRVGALFVLAATLRYPYVLCVAFYGLHSPQAGREAPRSRFGRNAFGVFCTSAIASLWPLEPWQRPFALFASGLILVSFARSLYASLSLR